MFCPMEYWGLGNPDNRNVKRYRIRRALAELLSSLSVLSWLGQMIIIPPDPPAEDDVVDARSATGPPARPVSGPPPGHPEQLPDGGHLTDAEREFWTHLEGLDWR